MTHLKWICSCLLVASQTEHMYIYHRFIYFALNDEVQNVKIVDKQFPQGVDSYSLQVSALISSSFSWSVLTSNLQSISFCILLT